MPLVALQFLESSFMTGYFTTMLSDTHFGSSLFVKISSQQYSPRLIVRVRIYGPLKIRMYDQLEESDDLSPTLSRGKHFTV